jgi:F-type H+-transporting ATPase subunit delta
MLLAPALPGGRESLKPISVAKRYARALADVAGKKEPACLGKISGELHTLARVLENRPQISRFFEDPSARRQDKDRAADTMARKAGVSQLTRQFLHVLIENHRLGALPTIATVFEAIKDERLGIVPVEATTAVPLSAADRKRFQVSLEKATGRRIRLSLQVDPSVLGGARTRIGSQVYDGTLRRQLAMLRERLVGAR